MAGNNALQSNPPNADISINTKGSDWLWAVFAIMAVSAIAMTFWQHTRIRGQKAFHTLPIAILTTASIAYFAMASDLGSTPVMAEYFGGDHQNYAGLGATRAIWYVRYIDWTITTPLLLLELLLATGLPTTDVFICVFMDLTMIITGLVGALVASSYKWGFFAFGCAALLYVWWILLGPARVSAGLLGTDVRSAYTKSAALLSFLWLLYPIAWGLSDGGNVITSDGEMIFYGILDILAKPVFCFVHLWSLRGIDLTRFGMIGTGVGGVLQGGTFRNNLEKPAGAPVMAGAPLP